MRLLSYIFSVLAVGAVAAAAFQASYNYFQSQELAEADGRLSLYQSSVYSELDRFSHLTYVLARDPHVIQAVEGLRSQDLNTRLEDFALRAGLEAIYLMSPTGLTIAASNHQTETSFIGQNYAFRPYFQQALEGQKGRFYAIGSTTGLPGYFIADPVLNSTGKIGGVIAIKIGFTQLEGSWRRSGEQVLLANQDGVVLMASNPDWLYQVLAPLSQGQKDKIQKARQFPGQPLQPLDWAPMEEGWAKIGTAERLHLSIRDLPHGWQLHYFASDGRALARSWLVTALVVFIAGLAVISIQFQRAQRTARALARAEREEIQLRQSNDRLAKEIEVRRTAERRLERTRDELERTSRLAALGRLAASVTHELGQPIAAMRNHLAAAEISQPEPSVLSAKISSLVDRMEGITRQLKFFARSDHEETGPVDLNAALQTSLTLVEGNLQETRTKLTLELADQPILITGSRLRVEQVMTNLLRNAIDASEEEETPQIQVSSGMDAGVAWFEVRDNGHGLRDAALADLQEPFFTTRASGRGMGLGLAISAGIVNDHGGQMEATNLPEGGARFRVTFAVPTSEEEGSV